MASTISGVVGGLATVPGAAAAGTVVGFAAGAAGAVVGCACAGAAGAVVGLAADAGAAGAEVGAGAGGGAAAGAQAETSSEIARSAVEVMRVRIVACMRRFILSMLTLDSDSGDRFTKLSLEEEVENQDWNDHQRGEHHELLDIRSSFATLELLEPNSKDT